MNTVSSTVALPPTPTGITGLSPDIQVCTQRQNRSNRGYVAVQSVHHITCSMMRQQGKLWTCPCGLQHLNDINANTEMK